MIINLKMKKSKKIVVVVEDEPDIVNVLKIRLESEGFDVLTAPDGKEGLRAIKEFSPDIVVLDLVMPEIGGLELCRIVKSDERLQKIPVIVLTARTEKKDMEESLNSGASAYFSKPYEWSELYAGIRGLLGGDAGSLPPD